MASEGKLKGKVAIVTGGSGGIGRAVCLALAGDGAAIVDRFVDVQKEFKEDTGPPMMNAFELITLSQGLNLYVLFDRRLDHVRRRQTCFTSKKPAKKIISRMIEAAAELGVSATTKHYKMKLEGPSSWGVGQMAVAIEVVPSLFMIEVRKALGDTLEYHKFYKSFCAQLKDIIWRSAAEVEDDLVSSVDGSVEIVTASKNQLGQIAQTVLPGRASRSTM